MAPNNKNLREWKTENDIEQDGRGLSKLSISAFPCRKSGENKNLNESWSNRDCKQDKTHWDAKVEETVVNSVMKLRFPRKLSNFLGTLQLILFER